MSSQAAVWRETSSWMKPRLQSQDVFSVPSGSAARWQDWLLLCRFQSPENHKIVFLLLPVFLLTVAGGLDFTSHPHTGITCRPHPFSCSEDGHSQGPCCFTWASQPTRRGKERWRQGLWEYLCWAGVDGITFGNHFKVLSSEKLHVWMYCIDAGVDAL